MFTKMHIFLGCSLESICLFTILKHSQLEIWTKCSKSGFNGRDDSAPLFPFWKKELEIIRSNSFLQLFPRKYGRHGKLPFYCLSFSLSTKGKLSLYTLTSQRIEITILKISRDVSKDEEEWDGVEVRLLRTVGEAMNFK